MRKKHFKNFVRYVTARYGAYTSFGIMEFWNELDHQSTNPLQIPDGKQVMGQWHVEFLLPQAMLCLQNPGMTMMEANPLYPSLVLISHKHITTIARQMLLIWYGHGVMLHGME